MKICCFFFDDDDYHGHIMGTIVTNDIVYYLATPITQKMLIVMTIDDDYCFLSKCLGSVITFALYLTTSRTKVRFKNRFRVILVLCTFFLVVRRNSGINCPFGFRSREKT